MLKVIKRIAIFTAGTLLTIAGLVGLVLPILPGVLLLIAGIVLLQYEWPWPYKMLMKLRTRYPSVNRSVERVSEWQAAWWARLSGKTAPQQTTGETNPDAASVKILIFDENIVDLAHHAGHFESQGFKVCKCASFETAMLCVESEEFDFVVVDQASLVFEGPQIIAHLTRDGLPIPFIVLTNTREEKGHQLALELGAAEYLEKPIGDSEMARIMQTYLQPRSKK